MLLLHFHENHALKGPLSKAFITSLLLKHTVQSRLKFDIDTRQGLHFIKCYLFTRMLQANCSKMLNCVPVNDQGSTDGQKLGILCLIKVIFSLSLDQQQVQQMLGHQVVPPARQWLPGQLAPQLDRGTRTTPTLNASDRL